MNFLKSIYLTFIIVIFPVLSIFAQVGKPIIMSDVRAFEVSATKYSNFIVSSWMEKRPSRKDDSNEAADMRVAYRFSDNSGKDWSKKGVVDEPNTFGTGNPFVMSDDKGNTYLVCMHIGQDFFSGNISLYEFDFKKGIFNWKSTPVKSSEHLLDKPSIVCNGDEIHLVYVMYTKNFKNSVKYQMSKDKGSTWTDPIDVFTDHRITYLGPSIAISQNKQILISCGSYGSKGIYLTQKEEDAEGIRFSIPKVLGKITSGLGSAMTELAISGKNLLVSWQNPHQRNEVWFVSSKDGGANWTDPVLVTQKGNLFSAGFDNNSNIQYIYSDFSDGRFSAVYKKLDSEFTLSKREYLTKPVTFDRFDEYLGAYQKLLLYDDKAYAFWIDYPQNSTLKFMEWDCKQ